MPTPQETHQETLTLKKQLCITPIIKLQKPVSTSSKLNTISTPINQNLLLTTGLLSVLNPLISSFFNSTTY